MKRIFLAAMLVFITLALTGCGDGGSSAPPSFVTQILSDSAIDGDISKDILTPPAFTITQGMSPNVQSVFAGVDPVSGEEFRAFLDFPLTGAGGVPGNAIIDSATLDIFINDIQPVTGTISMQIDLVSFQPPTLIATDYSTASLPALATIKIPIFQAYFGNHVGVDVTSLMAEAQRRGLANFQIRILGDLVVNSPGLIEIDDTTGADRARFAPLLEVTYF